MGSRYLYNPLQANIRSYFRFHINSTTEENIKGKAFTITKRLNIKEPLAVNKERLSSNIVLHSVTYGAEKDLLIRPRNCVLYFPHLTSSPEVVEKICSLYHDYGLDVVTMMPRRHHFHFKENGQSLVEELVNKLSGNNLPLHVDKFLVHTTSSGAYFYALLSKYLFSWSGSFNANRIRAQIFDKLTLGDPASALSVYRSPLPKAFVIGDDHLQEMAVDFANYPLPKDTLIYHSFDDMLSSSAETLIDTWIKRKLDVNVASWKASGYDDTYLSHPIKYTKALESFLVKIGFV